ncbi:MAG: hypothetical protein WCK35_11195, partial [Chloroflexota bacterium]
MSEIDDANEMIGKGYDQQPALEIESARTVIERRNGRMQEVERAAFVKISTAFKPEMKDIDEVALKVWLFIALSVNRNSGKANPGLRTIAEDCSFAVNTVRGAIERLETKYNLLIVHRNEKRYNIYEPVAFVSANKSVSVADTDAIETVSADDTDKSETVSAGSQTVSIKSQTVSARVIHNQSNQINQTSPKKSEKKGDIVDGFLAFAKSPAMEKISKIDEITSAFQVRLAFNLSGRDAENFVEFMYQESKKGREFSRFIDWWVSNGGPRQYWSITKMRQNWPAAFQVSATNPYAGWRNTTEERFAEEERLGL